MQRTTYALTLECAPNTQVKAWLEANSKLFSKTLNPNIVVLEMGPNADFDKDEKQAYLSTMQECLNATLQKMPDPFQVVAADAHMGRDPKSGALINNVLIIELKDSSELVKKLHEAFKQKYNVKPRFGFKLFVTLGYTITAVSAQLKAEMTKHFAAVTITPTAIKLNRRKSPQDELTFPLNINPRLQQTNLAQGIKPIQPMVFQWQDPFTEEYKARLQAAVIARKEQVEARRAERQEIIRLRAESIQVKARAEAAAYAENVVKTERVALVQWSPVFGRSRGLYRRVLTTNGKLEESKLNPGVSLQQPLQNFPPLSNGSVPASFLFMLTCEVGKEINEFLAQHLNKFSDSILNPDSTLLRPHSRPHISLLDVGCNQFIASKQNDPIFRDAIKTLFLQFNLLMHQFEIQKSNRFGRVGTRGEGKILVLELSQKDNIFVAFYQALKEMVEKLSGEKIKQDFQFIPHVTVAYTLDPISDQLLEDLNAQIAKTNPKVMPITYELCRRDGFGHKAELHSVVLAESQQGQEESKEKKMISLFSQQYSQQQQSQIFFRKPQHVDTNRYVLTIQCSLSDQLKKWIKDNKQSVSPFRPLYDDISSPIHLRLINLSGNVAEVVKNPEFNKRLQEVVEAHLINTPVQVKSLSATGYGTPQITLNLEQKGEGIMQFQDAMRKLFNQFDLQISLVSSKLEFVLGIPTPHEETVRVGYSDEENSDEEGFSDEEENDYSDEEERYEIVTRPRTKQECETVVAFLNKSLPNDLQLTPVNCQINLLVGKAVEEAVMTVSIQSALVKDNAQQFTTVSPVSPGISGFALMSPVSQSNQNRSSQPGSTINAAGPPGSLLPNATR